MSVEALARRVRECWICELHQQCSAPVPGSGSTESRVMLLGEAPGRNEDAQGEPFVGEAGKYLDAALKYVGLERDRVFVTNVVKCRPPGNRDPKPEEISLCSAWLVEEVMTVDPRLIVTLGRFAAQLLVGRDVRIMRDRGKYVQMEVLLDGRRVRATVFMLLHPAWILRGDRAKKMALYREDLDALVKVLKELGIGEA